MAFNEFDEVRIITKKVTGDIVDIYKGKNGRTYYLVQSNTPLPDNDPDVFLPGDCPLLECLEEELEKI